MGALSTDRGGLTDLERHAPYKGAATRAVTVLAAETTFALPASGGFDFILSGERENSASETTSLEDTIVIMADLILPHSHSL